MTPGDLADVYESFKRIPTYVMVIMIFTVVQFVVVACLGGFAVVQIRRIAEAVERHTQANQSLPPQYLPQQRYGQVPPQYGPRQ